MIGDEMYEKAREYGESVREDALAEARRFSREELEREYADAVSHAAYYAKIESSLSAVPRMSYDAIRQALAEIRADELLDQAARVEEEGGTVSNHVTVKTHPLLVLLSRCKLIVSAAG